MSQESGPEVTKGVMVGAGGQVLVHPHDEGTGRQRDMSAGRGLSGRQSQPERLLTWPEKLGAPGDSVPSVTAATPWDRPAAAGGSHRVTRLEGAEHAGPQ